MNNAFRNLVTSLRSKRLNYRNLNAMWDDEPSLRAKYDHTYDEIDTINLLIAGTSGVGKSTLINAIFGSDVAPVGIGEPTTKVIARYQNKLISIYDTPGFQISNADQTVPEVRNKIHELRESSDCREQIHIVWLCILEQSHRIEDVHVELLTMLQNENVPALVLITQAIARDADMESKVRTRAIPNKGVIPILAKTKALGDHVVRPFGTCELIEATRKALPDAIKVAFAAAQKVSYVEKEKAANEIIEIAAFRAFLASRNYFAPGARSKALERRQFEMLRNIRIILGLPLEEHDRSELTALVEDGGSFNVALRQMLDKIPKSMSDKILKRILDKIPKRVLNKIVKLILAKSPKIAKQADFLASFASDVLASVVGTYSLGRSYLDTVKGYAREGKPLPSIDVLEKSMAIMVERYAQDPSYINGAE